MYDRQQVASGSCELSNVACYVIARVIGVYPSRHEILIDAGACAMHKDPAGIQHYGILLDDPDLAIVRITQECGVVAAVSGTLDCSKYPLGTVVRVVPNHACMTACMHRKHYVVDESRQVTAEWLPTHGW